MFSKKTVTVAFILGACSAVFIGVSLIADPAPGDQDSLFALPAVGKDEAVRRSADFLTSLGIDPGGFSGYDILYSSRNQEALYLIKRLGYARARRLIAELRLPYAFWEITRGSFLTPPVTVAVDSATGEIIQFDGDLSVSPGDAPPAPATAVSEETARNFLAGLHWQEKELAGFDLVRAAQDERHDGVMTYTWRRRSLSEAGVPVTMDVSVAGARIVSFTRGLELPEDFRTEYEKHIGLSALLGGASFVYTGVLGIVALILAARHRKSLEWNAGRGWLLLIPAVFFLQKLNEPWSGRFLFDLAVKLLTALLLSLMVYILIPLTRHVFRSSFGKELFVLPAGRARLPELTVVMYSLAFAGLLFYFVFYYLLVDRGIAFETGVSPVLSEVFTSGSHALVPFLLSAIPAVTEEMFRAFTMAFLKRISGSTVLAVGIAAFLWGFGHSDISGGFFPGYIVGGEKFIIGILIGWMTLSWGIEAAVLWHFLNNFFSFGALIVSLGSGRTGGALMAGALAPFCICAWMYFNRRKTAVVS